MGIAADRERSSWELCDAVTIHTKLERKRSSEVGEYGGLMGFK